MPFKPTPGQIRFADLKVGLASTKDIDGSLYQTIQTLIDRLDQIQTAKTEDAGAAVSVPPGGWPLHAPTHSAGGTDPVSVTNLDGYPFDTNKYLRGDRVFAVPTVTAIAGPHAATHQPGGSDPMQVDAIPTTGSLRTLGTGAQQAAAGNDARFSDARPPLPHAPTHSQGGSDPVDVKNLAGYPGGTTAFLRADKTFAVPPGAGGGGMNLDYLGNYVSGPVYNDGDIVIGADGIAYMCVVDGTTTPPEPWPGVGIASPPFSDATFWTVTPHGSLSNERALNALANGYVKSTAGEPSTVAVIPVADGGTGATTASAARTNLGVGNVGTLNLSGDPNTFLNGAGSFVAPPTGVPSGVIILTLQSACPPGYTRITWMDGYFPRSNSVAGGAGGSGTHSHGTGSYAMPAHQHDAGTLATASHSHNFDVRTDVQGSHGHNFGVHLTANAHVVGDTGNNSASQGLNVLFGSVPVAKDTHTHHFDVNADVPINYDNATDVQGNHDHRVNGSTDSRNPAVSGLTGVTGPQAITGASDAQSHIPYFVDFLFCQKN